MATQDALLRIAATQIWQLAAVTIVIGAIVRLFARNRPYLAHLLWLVVIAKCLTPPVWSSPAGLFYWLQPGRAVSSASAMPREIWPDQPDVSIATEGQNRVTDDASINENRNATRSEEIRIPVRAAWPTLAASRWKTIVIGIWLAGTCWIFLFSASRVAGCVWRLKRTSLAVDPALAALVKQLALGLRLRARVRLVVTSSRVGPAVVGLMRPTIVLPEIIVRDRAVSELAPILAHELIHIRRGDLWIALLQVIAQALWWFHPLVWLAGRFVNRESERACDEAVIAELRCAPVNYAHSLLSILELKRNLVVMPAFPGVRPVDITSQRLERIMRMGQGCRRRAPLWCWLVVIGIGALMLPGGAMRAAQDAESEATQGTEDQATSAAIPRTYDVNDLMKAVETQLSLTGPTARRFLLEQLWNRMVGDAVVSGEAIAGAAIFNDPSVVTSPQEGQRDGSPERTWVEVGGKLLIRRPESTHARMAATLDAMRKFGFQNLQIEARFIDVPMNVFERLGIDFSTVVTTVPGQDQEARPGSAQLSHNVENSGWDSDDGGTQTASRASIVIEEELPLCFALLDEREAKIMLQLDGGKDVRLVSAPKVCLLSGQAAMVGDTCQSPFVVGLRSVPSAAHPDKQIIGIKETIARRITLLTPAAGEEPIVEPQIRVVESGSRLWVRPVLRGDSVRLDYKLLLSEIREVKKRAVPNGNVQVPVIARTELQSSIELPRGKSLLLCDGSRLPSVNRPAHLVLISVMTLPPDLPAAVGDNNPQIRGSGVNSNAGLVGELKLDSKPTGNKGAISVPSTAASSDQLKTAQKRLDSATRNLAAVEKAYNQGAVTLDLLLDAQRRIADAEQAVVALEGSGTNGAYGNASDPDPTIAERTRAERRAKKTFDITCRARDRSLKTWQRVYELYVVKAKGGDAADEAQAREQYFLFRQQLEDALKVYQDACASLDKAKKSARERAPAERY